MEKERWRVRKKAAASQQESPPWRTASAAPDLVQPQTWCTGFRTQSVARVGIAPKVPLSRKEPIPRSSGALGCGSLSPLAPEYVRVHRNASMWPLVYTCICLLSFSKNSLSASSY